MPIVKGGGHSHQIQLTMISSLLQAIINRRLHSLCAHFLLSATTWTDEFNTASLSSPIFIKGTTNSNLSPKISSPQSVLCGDIHKAAAKRWLPPGSRCKVRWKPNGSVKGGAWVRDPNRWMQWWCNWFSWNWRKPFLRQFIGIFNYAWVIAHSLYFSMNQKQGCYDSMIKSFIS